MAEALEGPCAGADVSSVIVISSAGAMLSQGVRDKLQAQLPAHAMILDNFGASETGFNGTGVAGSSPDAGLRFTVNDRTAVLDEQTLRPVGVGTGEVGRVAQRGHVPLGYYKDEARTKETFVEVDGERWVLLGDLATVEEDATIRVLGRASLCINTGGEKVFPEEVEAALKAHPAVFDAIVVGVPDEAYGSRVAAVVQVRDGVDPPSVEDLAAHCRSRVAGYKVPRVVSFVDLVQRSPSGKPDYPWATKVAVAAAS
jgi:acyl-coenzyme A synthetase/AMP-(fatty) acid ligase